MAKLSSIRARAVPATVLLGTLLACAACLGEVAGTRGAVGQATIDLRGLRALRGMNQVANDTSDEVHSARFAILAVSGSSKREVASHVFSSNDLNVSDSDTGTVFRMSFPYNTSDDGFEVLGYGFSAQGDTLYRVGPSPFTMKSATIQAGEAMVSLVIPPVYVGPGATATKLQISPRPVQTAAGKTTSVTATLFDASGKPLSSPTFRINWYVQDGSIANFPDWRIGTVQGGQRPGSSFIVARFDPLNLEDTVVVTNTVPPGVIRVISGLNQTGRVSTTLFAPINVQVLGAAGNFGLPGVPVSFLVTQGGGSVNFSSRVTSSPDGVASVQWTLGPTPGNQVLTIRVAGLADVLVTATATSATTP